MGPQFSYFYGWYKGINIWFIVANY
jgi:hypothetical protein